MAHKFFLAVKGFAATAANLHNFPQHLGLIVVTEAATS